MWLHPDFACGCSSVWVRKRCIPKVWLEGTQEVVIQEEIREEEPLKGGDMSSPAAKLPRLRVP